MTSPTQITLVVTLFDDKHTVGFLATLANDHRVVAVDLIAGSNS